MATVSCDSCINRLDDLERNDERAQDVYEVGNPAKPQMGHEMFFTSDGRTALCAAKRRQGPNPTAAGPC